MHLRSNSARVVPQLRWGQQVEPYSGPRKELYRAGVRLLETAQDRSEAAEKSADRYRHAANAAVILTTVLAAAAGITVIPESVVRWVSAALAFCAALLSGLAGAFAPARKATSASATVVRWGALRDHVDAYLRGIHDDWDGPAAPWEGRLAALQAESRSILEQTVSQLAAPTSPGEAAAS
jgi:hypothetical protein